MSTNSEFNDWLRKTLVNLGTDDEMFTPYITGILETDDPMDEKTESLQDIIAGITDTGIDELCTEIFSKWSGGKPAATPVKEEKKPDDDLDNKLAKLMEQQASCLPLATQKKVNKEQQELKKQILSQYAQVSGDEEDSDEGTSKGAAGGKLAKNTNAASVDEEVRLKREQDKEEHKLRKQKDKDDRDKQKAKVDERKEKEKKRTQKGERRR